jgi:hypothetical protein
MKKITITSALRNTEASFVPQKTSNPKMGTVSKAVQARVRRELGEGIDAYSAESWEVFGFDYYGVLSIRFFKP